MNKKRIKWHLVIEGLIEIALPIMWMLIGIFVLGLLGINGSNINPDFLVGIGMLFFLATLSIAIGLGQWFKKKIFRNKDNHESATNHDKETI